MEQTDAMPLTAEHSGEHPMVQVIQHSPLPGRRWFAVGWVLNGIAAILAVVLIAVPLWSYFDSQHRIDRETSCRSRIASALGEAQGRLDADLANGLTQVVRRADTTPVLTALDLDQERVSELSSLRGQADQLCRDDPDFLVPAAPTP